VQDLHLLPTVHLTLWQRRLVFEAHAADAAICVPGGAAAFYSSMLLLLGN